MPQMVDFYTDDIHDQFGLYGNWPPNETVALGDYGVLQDNWFRRVGNIKDLGISFEVISDPSQRADYTYQTAGSTQVTFNAAGTGTAGVPVKASLSISFSSDTSDFISASACVPSMIADQAALGSQILGLYEQDKWDFDYAIATGLMTAGSTTVIVSAGSNASIDIEADSTTVSSINLADASLSLSIKAESNIGLKVIAQAALIPFIGLSKMQHIFLGIGKKFGPYSATYFEASMKAKTSVSSKILGMKNPHYFGPIR